MKMIGNWRSGLFLGCLMLCLPALSFTQMDFSGNWAPLYHEDYPERIPGPELGDYMGIPVNDAARLRADSYGDEWFTVTTIITDPVYLAVPFVTTTDFKKEPDGSRWNPTTCSAR